jgi:hypothetical protein
LLMDRPAFPEIVQRPSPPLARQPIAEPFWLFLCPRFDSSRPFIRPLYFAIGGHSAFAAEPGAGNQKPNFIFAHSASIWYCPSCAITHCPRSIHPSKTAGNSSTGVPSRKSRTPSNNSSVQRI